eukprot:scaffold59261_cov49-Phaeocystis_antarctica.AAC.1
MCSREQDIRGKPQYTARHPSIKALVPAPKMPHDQRSQHGQAVPHVGPHHEGLDRRGLLMRGVRAHALT